MKQNRRVVLAWAIAVICAAVPYAFAQANRGQAGSSGPGAASYRRPNATAAYQWVDIMSK
jgi:hypothetical protein